MKSIQRSRQKKWKNTYHVVFSVSAGGGVENQNQKCTCVCVVLSRKGMHYVRLPFCSIVCCGISIPIISSFLDFTSWVGQEPGDLTTLTRLLAVWGEILTPASEEDWHFLYYRHLGRKCPSFLLWIELRTFKGPNEVREVLFPPISRAKKCVRY